MTTRPALAEKPAIIDRRPNDLPAPLHPHRQHLPNPQHFTAAHEFRQQGAAQALAAMVGVDVDRVFGQKAKGRAGPKSVGVGKAQNLRALAGHQVGQVLRQHRSMAARHLGQVGGVKFKAATPVHHMVAVNGGDGGQVGTVGRANKEGQGGHLGGGL